MIECVPAGEDRVKFNAQLVNRLEGDAEEIFIRQQDISTDSSIAKRPAQ